MRSGSASRWTRAVRSKKILQRSIMTARRGPHFRLLRRRNNYIKACMTLISDHIEADTRERILVVAERLFREIGYQKTTVADIAKLLRMSPANVYRFFDSKRSGER